MSTNSCHTIIPVFIIYICPNVSMMFT